MILKIGSTYAGAIDAFGYATTILKDKFELCWQIEKEKQAHKYLKKNYPNVKRYFFDEWFKQYQLEYVDIICGGDPCQPNSLSGNRAGEEDNRFRWPFMFDLIKTNRPTWVINENVTGSISNMVLDNKIADLEKIGYTCQAYIIPAVAVGACHTRKRVFLVANSYVQGRRELLYTDYGSHFKEGACRQYTLGSQSNPFLQFEESMAEPAIFSVDDGIPDHVFRLGAAGNSIYSAIPLILFEAIYEIERILRQ